MSELEVILWRLFDLSKDDLIKVKKEIEKILKSREDEN